MQVGTILSARDGIIRICGMTSALSGEMLICKAATSDIKAMVCNIRSDITEGVLFGDDIEVHTGLHVHHTNDVCSIPVGMQMFGKVLDPLGLHLDHEVLSGGPFQTNNTLFPGGLSSIELKAPGIIDRESVNEPLQTGIRAIDALIPIGRGQRELIIGDRQTGKSTLLFDILLNLQRENSYVKTSGFSFELDDLSKTLWAIYVLIGHRKGRVARIWKELVENELSDYICLITAFSSDAAPVQFLSAYSGCTQAEYVRDRMQTHAVIFYNDLSKHAVAYRQMSLLLRRPAGREAYPGDVFYIHSRLLERAAKLSQEFGSGSLTAFPVVETQAGDITAYIPTNIISITDGQIFLESSLFYRGIRPAINIGLSVSRVGSAAQVLEMKRLAGPLKLTLAQFREVEVFARMSVNLTNLATANLIKRGKILTQLFVQSEKMPMSIFNQIWILGACLSSFFDSIKLSSLSLLVESFGFFNAKVMDLDFLNESSRDIITFVNSIITSELLATLFKFHLVK